MFACSDLWPFLVNFSCFWSILLLPNFYSILQAQRVDEERMSASECQEAGFNSDTLKCSACRMLDKFNLEEILTDCMRCCEEEPKVEKGERFHIAELQVCKCNLHRFPQIAAFVQGDMKYQWGDRLVVKQVSGVLPTILLKSADGQTERTLNIEKWDTDTITDFLNNILQDGKDEL